MSQKKKILAAMFAAQIVLADPASAAVIFFDDFSGSNLDFLNGTSPDTNDLGTNPAATWATATTGDTTFRADGSVVSTTGQNTDRGAWLDLGAGFMAANTTYTVTLDFSSIVSSIIYFGFQNTTSPDLNLRGQSQGTLTVGGAIRNFSGRQEYSLISGNATETVSNLSYASSGTLTAVIQSNNLTNATVTVGNQTATFDGTNLRHFILAFEDGNTSASGITLNSITIDAVPEPSSFSLVLIGALGLFRRRR